jgi:Zn-dependent protease with chaperone function
MIFALRGILVALAFFGVLYCLLSLLVVCGWRCATLLFRNSSVGLPRLLFGLRILPLAGSAFATLAFALPAFFLLEGALDEDIGTLLFSAASILLLAAALIRVLTAQAKASRVVADWIEGSHALESGTAGSMLQTKQGLPPLLLYGVSQPRVLVSETAVALLTPDELQVAVRHEMGHIRSRDNLKKLILYATAFPGMASLERAWQEAAEFAADEAAVSNGGEAIDLAAALIKLCDLVPVQESPAFTTGLVDLTGLVHLRVQRLLAWDQTNSRARQLYWWCLLPAALLTVSYTVAHYGHALLFAHRLTEWFIG